MQHLQQYLQQQLKHQFKYQLKHHVKWMLLLLVCINGYSKTEVCGEIAYSQDWTLKGSPYIVTNDIYIPRRSRIRVEPGVVVQFKKPGPCKELFKQIDWPDSAYSTFKVEGALYLTGTEEQPVVFENFGGDQSFTGWDGIRIDGKSSILVEIFNVTFRGASNAVNVANSSFQITNCLFEQNDVGINLDNGANIRVTNNNFVKNRSSGVSVKGSNPIIYNNIFASNLNYGIWSDSRTTLTIGYNDFWKNSEGHCYKCESRILEFTGVNQHKDSVDLFFNLSQDPVFKGSPAHAKSRSLDLNVPTELSKVKNKKMAAQEWAAVKKRKGGAFESPFTYQGQGAYLLTRYSPLFNAGNPEKRYNDRDNTTNDMGYHGGPQPISEFLSKKDLKKAPAKTAKKK